MNHGDQKSPFIGKKVLHVGCGNSPLPAWLADTTETRFDIDLNCNPDVCGDMRSTPDVLGDERFDVVFSNHAVEHLYPHEVVSTLSGFRKVLNDGGVAIVIVPNLKGIIPNEDTVYVSSCGPITGQDMYYGKVSLLESMPYMAHHTGFLKETMEKSLMDAGFKKCEVKEDDCFNLIAVGVA